MMKIFYLFLLYGAHSLSLNIFDQSLQHTFGSTFGGGNLLLQIKANPTQFLSQLQKLDPQVLRSVLALLHQLLESSETRESNLRGQLTTAITALSNADTAVVDAEDVLKKAKEAKVTADQAVNAANTDLDHKETAHVEKKSAKTLAQSNQDEELPGLESDQNVLRDVIAAIEGLLPTEVPTEIATETITAAPTQTPTMSPISEEYTGYHAYTATSMTQCETEGMVTIPNSAECFKACKEWDENENDGIFILTSKSYQDISNAPFAAPGCLTTTYIGDTFFGACNWISGKVEDGTATWTSWQNTHYSSVCRVKYAAIRRVKMIVGSSSDIYPLDESHGGHSTSDINPLNAWEGEMPLWKTPQANDYEYHITFVSPTIVSKLTLDYDGGATIYLKKDDGTELNSTSCYNTIGHKHTCTVTSSSISTSYMLRVILKSNITNWNWMGNFKLYDESNRIISIAKPHGNPTNPIPGGNGVKPQGHWRYGRREGTATVRPEFGTYEWNGYYAGCLHAVGEPGPVNGLTIQECADKCRNNAFDEHDNDLSRYNNLYCDAFEVYIPGWENGDTRGHCHLQNFDQNMLFCESEWGGGRWNFYYKRRASRPFP